MGAGVPNVNAANEWLVAGHQAGVYSIRAQPDGGNTSILEGAYRRDGLASPADTLGPLAEPEEASGRLRAESQIEHVVSSSAAPPSA